VHEIVTRHFQERRALWYGGEKGRHSGGECVVLTDLEECFDDAPGQTNQENPTSIRLQHNDREEDEGVGVGERGQAAEEPVQSWMESRGSLKPEKVVEK
jgi:hypothetical protein